jgi:Ca-activated chloride channel homolog
MSFIWPLMLLTLLLVPVVVLITVQLQKKRQQDVARLGLLRYSMTGAMKQSPDRKRGMLSGLYFTALTLLLLSTARPEMMVTLPSIEGTVMLVFDVSASMAADDLSPSRLEAAKKVAHAFVEQQPSHIKLGVVAFSDGGLIVQPPTDDRPAVATTIDRLAPQTGTSLGRGILAALNVLSTASEQDPDDDGVQKTPSLPQSILRGAFAPVVILLLSDGENTDPPDPLEAAQIAIQQGVRIFTVGIGSMSGTTIDIDGFTVFTQLNEQILLDIAQQTEGEYFLAGSEDDLQTVFDKMSPQFVVKPTRTEITSLLAGISLVFLLVSGGLSLLWFGRVS